MKILELDNEKGCLPQIYVVKANKKVQNSPGDIRKLMEEAAD